MPTAHEVFLERLWDDMSFARDDKPPTNVPVLMERLGVEGKSREERQAAVDKWLEDNEPGLFLRFQLEEFGYITRSEEQSVSSTGAA
ncbi:hypothetical protein EML15_06670 [Corynebacterium sp. sy017]|uniref:hypothetical protein n=1 Tax=unclassified Corynebacterium TaxID=2624378 RepID=UPI001184ED43|nr:MULTISPECIES: hypothetical protein [unclassified Corynebacterium]MBP3088825.1 hypothetical protein [Corynebacterium sp. sy017]TSD91168.1 hypothetical protein ELY17_06680 [Corynebacterium sp. SY003]